jgi:hypothetical protein
MDGSPSHSEKLFRKVNPHPLTPSPAQAGEGESLQNGFFGPPSGLKNPQTRDFPAPYQGAGLGVGVSHALFK